MLPLRVLLFTLIVPGSVTVAVPWLLLTFVDGGDRAASVPRSLPGLTILVVGVAIYAWCAWDFAARGRGTPAPWDPPSRLVTSGLYRYVRNPMYMGIIAIIAGEASAWGSLALAIYAGLLWLAFHLRVALFEEPDRKSVV